jgi:hypothetical protein
MIPFTLGFIGGFAFAILLLTIYAVLRASSMRSREEEAWVENIGCTMQGMSDQAERMPSTLRELHRLEEETQGNQGADQKRTGTKGL